VLSGFGINIESLETLTYPAPVSGTPLFRLQAHLAVPTRTNIDEVLEHLERLQRDENIDIELSLQNAG
jgi:glycine cleavage system transcriptional repressor